MSTQPQTKETQKPAVASIVLSPDQQVVHDAVLDWWTRHKEAGQPQILTLGGYAGTGKTTLIAKITYSMRHSKMPAVISFCCFTGKASLVLRQKLWKAQAIESSYCGTIHGLIYAPIVNPKTQKVTGWRLKGRNEVEGNVFILDEASMVDEKLLEHLKSFGRPILAVGDHGQLPPVSGTLNLMQDPKLRLEKIHRQATDNPIIRVSILARELREIKQGYAEGGGGSVQKVGRGTNVIGALPDLRNTMFICGTNRTRTALNSTIRTKLGYTGEPQPGERLICLRNWADKGIYNGMMGTLEKLERSGEHWYNARIRMDGEVLFEGEIFRHQFGQQKTITEWPGIMPFSIGARFDWAWAITAHKSQGSEYERVVVYDDCDWMKDESLKARWRYTAITRASKELIIVGD